MRHFAQSRNQEKGEAERNLTEIHDLQQTLEILRQTFGNDPTSQEIESFLTQIEPVLSTLVSLQTGALKGYITALHAMKAYKDSDGASSSSSSS